MLLTKAGCSVSAIHVQLRYPSQHPFSVPALGARPKRRNAPFARRCRTMAEHEMMDSNPTYRTSSGSPRVQGSTCNYPQLSSLPPLYLLLALAHSQISRHSHSSLANNARLMNHNNDKPWRLTRTSTHWWFSSAFSPRPSSSCLLGR